MVHHVEQLAFHIAFEKYIADAICFRQSFSNRATHQTIITNQR
jgi:hypothetical protein